MRSRRITITIYAMVINIFPCVLPVYSYTDFNDGGIHDIAYEINDDVRVDWEMPGIQTTVNFLDGGLVTGGLGVYGDGQANIFGGSIVGDLAASPNSCINLFGGSIGADLEARVNSEINLFGGIIDGILEAEDSAVLSIHGSSFAIDGQPVSYGELFSVFGGNSYNEPIRHITGILLSGELLDNDFQIGQEAAIVLIPEPATFLLLGLGAVMLRKRR